MAFTIASGEAKRKDLIAFYITDPTKAAALTFAAEDLEPIGKGIEAMPIQMNAQSEEGQDVLGNSYHDVTGYQPTMQVTPIKQNGDSKLATWVDTAVEEEYTLDQLVIPILIVKKYKTEGSDNAVSYRAWVQDCTVDLKSFADGLRGVAASMTLNFTGERKLGKVAASTMAFTADT